MPNTENLAGLIWDIAELLRGDYKRSDYGKVILPFTVLRRLDCVLQPTKAAVLEAVPEAVARGDKAADFRLNKIAGYTFHNRSRYTWSLLLSDPNAIAANLTHYVNGFSANIREIFEYFSFAEQIIKLDKSSADLLYQVVVRFGTIDLLPRHVSAHDMGNVFEELIRRFSEQSNETAGEHFTPREVIKLMVDLLFQEDRAILTQDGIVRTLYDPACGTGGMLSIAEEYLHELNTGARLEVFGQELNPESYAICKADMIIKGNNAANMKFGNSFTSDGLADKQFDYMLSNPPFGVEWKKVETIIRAEKDAQGWAGRFGAGLPRISDGSLLFLQHMLSKRKDTTEGTRLAIVFNGSPLFSGGAGSGESEIRRWIIERDWLEAVIALPDQLFYNTGISTYIWIVTNRKSAERQGKVQLINAAGFFVKKRKSLGNKRNEIGDGTGGNPNQIAAIVQAHGAFASGPHSKIFDNQDFGYRRITVERPLRLSFALTPERLAKIKTLTLPEEVKSRALTALTPALPAPSPSLTGEGGEPQRAGRGSSVYQSRAAFLPVVLALYVAAKLSPPSPRHLRLILEKALGVSDETAEKFTEDDGKDIPDPDLRDFENVPLKESVTEYFAREVLPHVPDAWINTSKRDETDGGVGVVGYEIPFTRHFYEYTPLRPLDEIEADILTLETRIQGMLREAMK
jgi:type I restriction enzyme M protein